MNNSVCPTGPKALIIGHSFVCRLKDDLLRNFDSRASLDFGLDRSMEVLLHGVAGLRVTQLRRIISQKVRDLSPDAVLLEIGTNDLGSISPEIVGSDIHDIVEYLHFFFGIKMVAVCLVIPRRVRHSDLPDAGFNLLALKLNQYLSVLLDDTPFAFVWHHEELELLDRAILMPDGVHLNPHGQYKLYRSYRGALLKALTSSS